MLNKRLFSILLSFVLFFVFVFNVSAKEVSRENNCNELPIEFPECYETVVKADEHKETFTFIITAFDREGNKLWESFLDVKANKEKSNFTIYEDGKKVSDLKVKESDNVSMLKAKVVDEIKLKLKNKQEENKLKVKTDEENEHTQDASLEDVLPYLDLFDERMQAMLFDYFFSNL